MYIVCQHCTSIDGACSRVPISFGGASASHPPPAWHEHIQPCSSHSPIYAVYQDFWTVPGLGCKQRDQERAHAAAAAQHHQPPNPCIRCRQGKSRQPELLFHGFLYQPDRQPAGELLGIICVCVLAASAVTLTPAITPAHARNHARCARCARCAWPCSTTCKAWTRPT